MKKLFIFLFAAVAVSFASCTQETDPEGTAIEEMCGDWYVTYQNSLEEYYFNFYDAGAMPSTDTLDNWIWIDYYGYGDLYSRMYTFNVASNASDTMFISDAKNYWYMKGKVNCNADDMTFQSDTVYNSLSDSYMKVLNGKILKDAATTPSGNKADSIIFYVRYFDDSRGFTYTKVSGFRRTGFPADDFE
jgi:hypothetical protein